MIESASARGASRRGRPRLRAAAVLALATLSLAGCAGSGGGTRAPAPDASHASLSKAPEPFQAMRSTLVRVGTARQAKDATTLRALFPEVIGNGRNLLKMRPPNDLDREDVPRFLEARGTFTDELNAYGRAQQGRDDAALFAASSALEDAYWAWYDVYRGKAPAGSV